MKKLIVLIAALALSACVSPTVREGQRASWRCDTGKEFSLRHVPGAVEVYASGRTHRLEQTGEDTYAANGVTYAVDGGRATLTGVYNGPFENCRREGSLRFW